MIVKIKINLFIFIILLIWNIYLIFLKKNKKNFFFVYCFKYNFQKNLYI